jgi:hypothetical protein
MKTTLSVVSVILAVVFSAHASPDSRIGRGHDDNRFGGRWDGRQESRFDHGGHVRRRDDRGYRPTPPPPRYEPIYKSENLYLDSEGGAYKERFLGRDATWRFNGRVSKSACQENVSYGFNRATGYLWVDKGCRANFIITTRVSRSVVVACWSNDGDYDTCDMGFAIRNVEVRNRVSNADCRKNIDYGFTNDRLGGFIWVDNGCRADFEVFPQY